VKLAVLTAGFFRKRQRPKVLWLSMKSELTIAKDTRASLISRHKHGCETTCKACDSGTLSCDARATRKQRASVTLLGSGPSRVYPSASTNLISPKPGTHRGAEEPVVCAWLV